MGTWLRRLLWAVLMLVLLAAGAVLLALHLAQERAERRITVPSHPLVVRADAAALERGRYLFASRGCAECHGASGAGRLFVDQGVTRLAGPNITPMAGTPAAKYSDVDWARLLRHGVKPDGRPARVMPSEDYARMTDADIAALVAYARSLPAAPGAHNGGAAVIELPLPARVLYGLGQIPDAADRIDHSLPPAQPVPEGVTLEHGRYVAQMCTGCHGPHLAGGRIPGGPPDWPPASRLASGPDSVMPSYATAESFVAMLKSGRRPSGSAVAVMPFEMLRELNDTDARALYLYLKSL
jgi:mono/diheme cytochrome c family protein